MSSVDVSTGRWEFDGSFEASEEIARQVLDHIGQVLADHTRSMVFAASATEPSEVTAAPC